jgi:hypothetical protein
MVNHLQLKATFYMFFLGHVSRHALVKIYKILPPSVAFNQRFGSNHGFDGAEIERVNIYLSHFLISRRGEDFCGLAKIADGGIRLRIAPVIKRRYFWRKPKMSPP